MDTLILMIAAVAPALLISRYRAAGLLFSIPLCWGILALALLLPSDGTWRDREFREEWSGQSAVLSIFWCMMFSSAALFVRWVKQKWSRVS